MFEHYQVEESRINAMIGKFSKVYGLITKKHKIDVLEKANTLIFDAYKTFDILKRILVILF